MGFPHRATDEEKIYVVLKELIDIIESVAPLGWQEEWDNSGLQVGNRNAEIHAALLTTDITEAVVREAIDLGCELVISHHPLLFHGLKQVCGQDPQARCVEMAIAHHIAIYSSHTSMDSVLHGVSGHMAELLGVTNYRLLVPTEDHSHGLGVIGELPQPMTLAALLAHIKEVFNAPCLRYVTGATDKLQRVAICGGAGAEFIDAAIAQGADAFITADVKYHDFQAADGRIAVIDMDHWVSEHFTRDIFAEMLRGKVKTYISQADKTPVKTF